MTLLSDLFDIHINQNQLKKIYKKYILENEDYQDEEIFLEEEYYEYKETLLENIDTINVHSILDCSYKIRKQFIFIASPLDKHLSKIAFSLFKKYYDYNKKDFNKDIGICRKSFIIDIYAITPDKFNWITIDKNKKMNINDIKHIYEYNIKHEDFSLYQSLYNNYIYLGNFDCKEWGPMLGIYDLSWNCSVDNVIKEDFGLDIYEKNYDNIQYYYFYNYRLEDIYYTNTMKDSFIYNFIKQKAHFVCDYCNSKIGDLKKNDGIWHNSIYGDLCNSCFMEKYNLARNRINNKRKEIILSGKINIFRKDLAKTKKYLKEIGFVYNNNKNEYNNTNNRILNKIVKQLIKNSKRGHCGICLDVLDCNLVGGDCGHCFHKKCLELNNSDLCPLCRNKSNFVKLHLE